MHKLQSFALGDVTVLGAAVREVTKGATTLEEGANRVVRCLYERLVDADGRPAAALLRCYKLHSFKDLEAPLKAFAQGAIPGVTPGPDTRCLTLIATVGAKPDWNDRTRSNGHKAVPLANEKIVQSIPMIAQLVRSLGLAPAAVVAPAPELFVGMKEETFNVFHVLEAVGSPYVPAQAEFVIPSQVKSVVGFGFLLPPTEVVAFILFSRVRIEEPVAQLFKSLALSVKLALLPLASKPVFAGAKA